MNNGSTLPVIFLAFANDRQDGSRYLRNLPEEARRLRALLGRAQEQGLCELVVRQGATIDDILDVFQHDGYRNRIAFFHYGGHANSYQLLFETAEGKPALADAAGLAAFLGQQTGLETVFLNGCSTQEQARGLLDAGVSAVVATSQDIDDRVATDFAARFYQALAGGVSLSVAFKEAEGAVRTTLGGTRDGGTRDAYRVGARNGLPAGQLPWDLYLREDAEAAAGWNLRDAANNPLFGLPPLPYLDLPPGPYRYLDWYRREDAEVFFGRAQEIRELYQRLTAPQGEAIILFYGQSGVGKSSLLAAGVLPRLEQEHALVYCRRDQNLGLLGTLQAELGEDLSTAWAQIERREERPLVVILDQVEEHYTRPISDDPAEIDTLLAALQVLFADPRQRPRGRLILSFRKEWLAEIRKQLDSRRLGYSELFLQGLDQAGIMEVVCGPTQRDRLRNKYQLSVDEDLPLLIADDLRVSTDSPVAPMLQILLSKMWSEARKKDPIQPRFTEELYLDLRQEGLGLDRFLEEQLAELEKTQPQAVKSGLALDLLVAHTTARNTAAVQTGSALLARYAPQQQVLPALIQAFQDLYLLVAVETDDEGRPLTTRLAHDTLATEVRQRFDRSEAPGQVAHRVLQNRVREYRPEDEGPLLDEWALEAVEAGRRGMRVLTEEEAALVALSQRKLEGSKPPELEKSIFPSTLRVREFVPGQVLAVHPNYPLWLAGAMALAAGGILLVSGMLGLLLFAEDLLYDLVDYFWPIYIGSLVILAGISYIWLKHGATIRFDLDYKVVRMPRYLQYVISRNMGVWSMDPSITFRLLPGGNWPARGELRYGPLSIVRAHATSMARLEEKLLPLGRALNHAMGFASSLSATGVQTAGK